MSQNFPYPRAPKDCWSLSRLVHCLRSEQGRLRLQEQGWLWIGGRFRLIDAQPQLLGQGVRLQLPIDMPGDVCSGDWIAIGVDSEQLRPEPLRVGEVKAVQILAASQAEQRPLKVGDHTLRLWQNFVATVREFFVSEGLLEVSTPSLVVCPGVEPTLEPMATEVTVNGTTAHLFLPTSPELHLKKLLAQGFSDIFEIKSCFRNNELSPHHQPEFWMLEWYRSFAGLDAIIEDIERLLSRLTQQGFLHGSIKPLEKVSVAELFQQQYSLQLTPTTSKEALLAVARESGLTVTEEDDWDDIFHLLFLQKIEPSLGGLGPQIVYDYPPSQAALARINDHGWADRFELYWRGMELANAFHELNDPKEQRRRFELDRLERRRRGRTQVPIDEEFLLALESGMPPSGGVALGLERLFLAMQNMQSLDQVRVFPITGP